MASYMIAFRGWEDAGSIIEYFEYGYYNSNDVWETLSTSYRIIDLGIPGLIFNLIIYTGLPLLGKFIEMPEIAFFPLGFAAIRMITNIIHIFREGY